MDATTSTNSDRYSLDSAKDAERKIVSGAHDAVDQVASAAHGAAETLSEKSDELMAAQERLLMALGIAAAVGFVFSRLSR
jgi:ElaB/YqjD/DUF883 family membrane-anchored ribosome-binding protein